MLWIIAAVALSASIANTFQRPVPHPPRGIQLLIRRAKREDLQCTQALLRDNRLPSDHLEREIENLFVLEDDNGEVAGCACLCLGQLVELRSVCIRSDLRGRGWGRQLVEAVLREAIDRNIAQLYLRTGATGFFASLGFRELPKGDLARLWKGCSECPRLGTAECRHVPMVLER